MGKIPKAIFGVLIGSMIGSGIGSVFKLGVLGAPIGAILLTGIIFEVDKRSEN